MAFSGFPVEAIEFYDELALDNTKAFWTRRKADYETFVRAPVQALLDELAGEYGDGKIFRPYRDVRFSKDKTPYKDHIGATLASGGYVQLSSSGLGVGTGDYGMAKDQLASFRAAVADDDTGREFVDVVRDLRRKKVDVRSHDALKTAPRGYPKDHERIEYLRMKGCYAWREWEPAAWFDSRTPVRRIREFFEAARPLVDWLDEHVGPSELEASW